MIIQNVCLLKAELSPENRRVYLKNEVLRDKKINRIQIFTPANDATILDPDTNTSPSFISSFSDLSAYFNIVSSKGTVIAKDKPFDNVLYRPGDKTILHEFEINQLIDIDQSYLTYNGTITLTYDFLMYIYYQTENLTGDNNDNEASNILSVNCVPTSKIQDISLRNLVGNQLDDKKIKIIKIKPVTNPLQNDQIYGYLDLNGNTRKINNIPCTMLQLDEDIYFDNLIIDMDNSYYRSRIAGLNLIIAFKLIFIYE